MILHVLESALCYEGEPWNTVIPKSAVDKAEHILNYIVDQKFALMHPEIQVKTSTTQCSVPLIPDTYLSKFLSFNKSVISASDVSQYRLMPPSPLTPQSKNKYPVENVRKFMSSISSAGFGQVLEELRSGSKRKATIFRKHSLQDMATEQQSILKKLKVAETSFDSSTSSNTSFETSIYLTTPTSSDDEKLDN